MIRTDLKTFKNDYQIQKDYLYEKHSQAVGAITIDGYADDPTIEGQVICTIFITLHRDIVVSYTSGAESLYSDKIQDLIQDAVDRLYKDYDQHSNEPEEMTRAILDVFENLLDKHNIDIPSDDRTGAEEEAHIYGDAYFELEDTIQQLLTGES